MSNINKTVLITGASGHLGGAVAAAFRATGAQLVLVDRQVHPLKSQFGDDKAVHIVEADLVDREAVLEAVGSACSWFNGIDAVCHIAGGFRMGELVHETAPQTWDFLMDLNARSLLNLAAATVPTLQQRGTGYFVTVGAGAAQKGSALMGAYSASKSALIRLTESMSSELKNSNINVNCVLPSIIDTPDNRLAMPDADHANWVTPAALANVIMFLASDAASAIHGAAVPVIGKV